MKVYINYDDKRWLNYNIDYEKIVNEAIKSFNLNKDAEISITLTDAKTIHKLNKKYRNIDSSTNVLSFELDDDILLGDIYLSFENTKNESDNFEQHTTHLIVHGVLHLLGFDHIKESEARVMENKEIQILKRLGIKNPYKKSNTFFIMIICGIIASLGFAPLYLTILSIISYMIVYYLFIKQDKITIKESIKYIFPFTVSYSISMFCWILNSIYVLPELADKFAIWTIPSLIMIGIFGGIIFSIPFICLSFFNNNQNIRPVIISLASALFLWFREWFLTGFPWNPISNLMINFTCLYNSLSLWGSIGLTFIVVLFFSSLIEIIKNRQNKGALFTFIISIILVIIGIFFGIHNINKIKNYENINIRIIQPSFLATDKVSYSKEQALIKAENNVIKLKQLALSKSYKNIDLLVFPETTYPYIILDGEKKINLSSGIKTIIGANTYKNTNLYNSMIFVDEKGYIKNIYDKRHLVPFGEFNPFKDLFFLPNNLTSGKEEKIFDIKLKNKSFKIIPAICYEIIFSDSLINKHQEGDFIINITNDMWFGKTIGVYQHLDMVRRYAVESGLPIVRANYSGISAMISHTGKIVQKINIGQSDIIDVKIYKGFKTIYRKIGKHYTMIIVLMFSLFLLVCISLMPKKD